MFKKFIFIILSLFMFFGCSKKEELKIAANTWIGYVPLFYADAKGWLHSENIKLLHTVSLNESLQLYNDGFVRALACTQYEAGLAKKKVDPVILLDKSYGADMVMSNYDIHRLKKFRKTDVYLEVDSVNSLLLKYFIKQYSIAESKLKIHNMDQAEIVSKDYDDKPVIIVTYSPYDSVLKTKHFKILDSTKTNKELIVMDAVFSAKNDIKKYKKRFKKLKYFIDRALADLKKNPKNFYYTIRPYMGDYSYKDFETDLHHIKWINDFPPGVKGMLKKLNMPDKEILK